MFRLLKAFSYFFLSLVVGLTLMSAKYSIAQTSGQVRGVVEDNSGRALPRVTVTLRNQDSTIVSYTSTRSDGTYELKINPAFSGFICATSLGYKQSCKVITTGTHSSDYQVNFVLVGEQRIIDEVNVEAKRSITMRGDTITYRLDAFTNETERTLEDALAKLPGFRVDEHGTISVNGQNIRKIMVEDEDLVGENYKLVSRNLSADMIAEVEVLNRYLDNPLHQGIIDSDDVALNLKFKADRKRLLFGDAEVAAGIRARYEGAINGLVFSPMVKGYTLLKANNVGSEIAIPVIETTAPAILGTPFVSRPENSWLLDIASSALSSSLTSRTSFNNGQQGSANFVSNPMEKLSITGNIHLGNEAIHRYSSSMSQLFSNGDTLSYNELNEQGGKPVSVMSSIEMLYKVTKSSSLQVKYAYLGRDMNDRSSIISDRLPIDQIQNSEQSYHRAYLNYSKRVNNGLLLEIQSVYIDNELMQEASLPYEVAHEETPLLLQKYRSPFRSTSTQAKAVYDAGANMKLGFSLDYKYIKDRLVTEIADIDTSFSWSALDFMNDNQRLAQQTALTVNGVKSFGRFRFSAHITSYLENIRIENMNTTVNNTNESDFYSNYNLNVRWRISRRHSLTLSMVQDLSTPSLNTLYSGFVFSNYRVVRNYSGENFRTKSRLARLSYRYQFPYQHLFVNAHVHYGTISNLLSYEVMYNPQHIFLTGRTIHQEMPSFGYRASGEKLFRDWSLMVSLSSQFMQNRYINSVNNRSREINQALFINELSVNSVFRSPYNMFISFRNVTNFHQNSTVSDHRNGTSNWIFKFSHSWKINPYMSLVQTMIS